MSLKTSTKNKNTTKGSSPRRPGWKDRYEAIMQKRRSVTDTKPYSLLHRKFSPSIQSKPSNHRRQNALFLGSDLEIKGGLPFSQQPQEHVPRRRRHSSLTCQSLLADLEKFLSFAKQQKLLHPSDKSESGYVQFSNQVIVYEIPNRNSYTSQEKSRIWNDRLSMLAMVNRNNIEQMWEYQKKGGEAVEEEDFQKIGEIPIHPAHIRSITSV